MPISKDETVTVVFDEFRGKVLAEEWEREASKLGSSQTRVGGGGGASVSG